MSKASTARRPVKQKTRPGEFFAAPPMAQPVMPWRPEYGSIEDKGQSRQIADDVYVYTSPDYTMGVNSVYAIRSEGVFVLDTQLLTRQTEALVSDIRARTNGPIVSVANSHHHPDHTFGNQTMIAQGAELISSYLTARCIDSSSFWYLMFLTGLYGPHLPPAVSVPRQHFVRSKEITLGKSPIQLFEYADTSVAFGESMDLTMAWFPRERILCTADVLWNRMHTFFSDGTSVPDWHAQLASLRDLVRELQPKVIVPGHGLPGDAGLIDAQERYLNGVARLVMEYCDGGDAQLTDENRDKLRQEIVNEFPECGVHMALDISLSLIQMVGPTAFLNGWPGGAPPPRLPTFL